MCPFWKRKGAKEHDETVQLVPFCTKSFSTAFVLKLLDSYCWTQSAWPLAALSPPLEKYLCRGLLRCESSGEGHTDRNSIQKTAILADEEYIGFLWFFHFSTKLVLVGQSRSFREILWVRFAQALECLSLSLLWRQCMPLLSMLGPVQMEDAFWLEPGFAPCQSARKTLPGWAKLIEGILVSRTVDMSFGLKFRFHAGKEEETKKTPRSRGPFLTRL